MRGSQIAEQPHGPLVGIPGAPSEFSPTTPATSSWLVCDSVTPMAGVGAPPVTVTVIDGTPDLSNRRHVLNGSDAVVLRYEKDTYVVRQGRRSRIDSTNRAVLLPLGLTPETRQPGASDEPCAVRLVARRPRVDGAQGPGRRPTGSIPSAPGPIGTVIVTPQISGPQQYSVVLADGVQTVNPLVAQILQNAGTPAGNSPVVVAPASLAKMPVVNGLDLSAYPDAPLSPIDLKENPATCWWWQKTAGEERARIQVISGPTIPVPNGSTDKVVSLVKADSSGREADHVYFGPEYGNWVVVTGNDPGSSTSESLWWLTSSGARFGVENTRDSRSALGLTAKPSPAPWVALRLLAPGPALSRADALVRHDTLPTDMNPAELVVPK